MNNVLGLAGIVGGLAVLFLFAFGIVYIIYRSERSTPKVDHKSSITQPPDSAANTKTPSPRVEHVRAKSVAMKQNGRVEQGPPLNQRPPQKPRRPPETRP